MGSATRIRSHGWNTDQIRIGISVCSVFDPWLNVFEFFCEVFLRRDSLAMRLDHRIPALISATRFGMALSRFLPYMAAYSLRRRNLPKPTSLASMINCIFVRLWLIGSKR